MSTVITASVCTGEQLRAVLSQEVKPARVYMPLSSPDCGSMALDAARAGVPVFAVLPFVLRREKGIAGPEEMLQALRGAAVPFAGALARNIEELACLRAEGYEGTVEADHTIPLWNGAAYRETSSLFDEWTLSPELSQYEIPELLQTAGAEAAERAGIVCYGRVPMMISANCIRRTDGRCPGRGREPGFTDRIRDRKGRILPVQGDCRYCYNVIRNAVPASLYRYAGLIASWGTGRMRIDLTTEDAAETARILRLFTEQEERDGSGEFPWETTTGRFRNGVE